MGSIITTNAEVVAALEQLPLALQRFASEISVGLQSFNGSSPLQGSRSVAVSRKLVWGGAGRLVGWSLAAVGATTAIALLRDSRDTSGDPIAAIVIPAGGTSVVTLPGASYTEALYLDVLAGTGITGGSLTVAGTPGASWSPKDSLAGAFYLGEVD